MAFREIKQFQNVDENLFEPADTIGRVRAATQGDPILRFRGFLHHPLALLSFGVAVEFVIAIVLVYFGITLGGSYYGPVSGKFTGTLATIFYQWQVGTMMSTIGLITAYDAVKKLF